MKSLKYEALNWVVDIQKIRMKSLKEHGPMFNQCAVVATCWEAPVLYLVEGVNGTTSAAFPALTEAYTDTFSSIALATEGLYKLSFVAMRHLIEDTLQAIVGSTHPEVMPHPTPESKTPNWKTFRDVVFESSTLQDYRQAMERSGRPDLADMATDAYAHDWYDNPGSKAAHSHPLLQNFVLWNDVPTIPTGASSEALAVWAECFIEVNRLCLLWTLLMVPAVYGWSRQDPHFTTAHGVDWNVIFEPEQQNYLRVRHAGEGR